MHEGLSEAVESNDGENNDEGSQKTTPVARSVRFSPGTKAAPSTKVQWRPVPRKNPAKVGKANPIRDLGVLLGILGFLFFIAYLTNDVGTPRDDGIQEFKKALQTKIIKKAQEDKKRKRKTECELFLGQSSVPGAGFGVFAGKQFAQGDKVIHPGIYYPLGKHFVAQYGFVLKHHPYLANLANGQAWSETKQPDVESPFFTASRTIEAGEELFLDYNSHPQQKFGDELFHIPGIEDYEIADEILKEMLEKQSRYGKPKRKKKTPESVMSVALKMTRKAVTVVNRRVGYLLPASNLALQEIDARDSTMAFASLKNQTVYQLELDGHCLDDTEALQMSDENATGVLYAKRPIKAGNTVIVSPLRAVRSDQTCLNDAMTCSTRVARCLGHVESSLSLCPLSNAAFITPTKSVASESSPNVEYRWSSWNKDVENALSLSPAVILQDYALSLSLDVVALRDIQVGETISSAVGPGVLPESMFPVEWKDSITLEGQ